MMNGARQTMGAVMGQTGYKGQAGRTNRRLVLIDVENLTGPECPRHLDLAVAESKRGEVISDLPREQEQTIPTDHAAFFLQRSWWMLLTLPLGLTTWAAFLYVGLRTKRRDLLLAAAIYGVGFVIAFVLIGVDQKGALGTVGALIAIGMWIGGIVQALIVRSSVERQLGVGLVDRSQIERASRGLYRREYGRRLLQTNPALARQLGVGRPDVQVADSFGLVDVNRANAEALAISSWHVSRNCIASS